MDRTLLAALPAAALCCGLATAQSQFAPGRAYQVPPISTTVYDVTAGDVDGDGFADLVLGNDHAPNLVLLNDRLGGFRDATAGRLVTPAANATYQVDLADVDGDGDLDLVVANDHYLSNRLYLNAGMGFFTDVTATNLPANADYSECQVVVDLDRDGDLDIVFGNLDQDRLYLNNGAGVFTDATATHLPVAIQRSRYMAAGDLDGDGDPDLLISSWSFGGLRVLLNSGAGRFTAAPAGFLPTTTGATPEIVDVNGDGRMDVFLDGGWKLLLARPGGGFVDVSATNVPGLPTTYSATTADIDLDGDLDLLGGRLVMLNDGTGMFTDVSGRLPYGQATRYNVQCIADFDGDGDPDLFVPSYTGSLGDLYMNFDRQLDAPAGPVRGSTYSLDLWARPGYSTAPHVAIPAWSFRRGLLPLPGFGILGLDPGSLHAMPLVTIPQASGRLTLSMPVPVSPAFSGVPLCFQAVVFDPAQPVQLSNVVADTIR